MYLLNEQQKKAVEHLNNPLLVVAGAGTGKTTVITQKIGWLVERELAKPDEILALTFTEKAAGEMEERADKLMPYGYVDMWIMTFHGFCEKILQQHGLDIGLATDFKLLNEFGQWALVKKNLDKFDLDYYRPLGNQTKFISALLKHFSRAKDEDISPREYLAYAEELRENADNMLSGGSLKKRGNSKSETLNPEQIQKSKIQIIGCTDAGGDITKEMAGQEVLRINEVANAYHVYQQLLLDNNCLDFGDLINYTLALFRKRPAVLQKFRQKFKYILIDEFQDTNWAQYELIKILSPKGRNLTVVGDDDQSIFRFRGASMSNILQFKNDYKDAKEVILTKNYRSAQNILDKAYEFIKLNNPNRLEVQLGAEINKRLMAETKDGGFFEAIQGSDLQNEAKLVVEKIIELKNSDPEAVWNDFAVLVRANNSARDFTSALEAHNVPYIFLAARGLYSRPVIMDVISYLNLLDNYHESTSMHRVLNIPVFHFTSEEIIGFLRLANRKAWSLYETLGHLASFSKEPADKIKNLLSLIERHAVLAKEKKASEVVIRFLDDSSYLKHLSAQEPARAKEAMRELNAFLKRVKEFEASSKEALVRNFLSELHLEMESGEEGSLAIDPETGPEMVKVMTVHGSKGLEFKYVFVAGMVDLRFPTTERKELIALPDALVKEILPAGDTHLEEERRLFYVAMTRAKKGLYFSWSPDYGGQRKKKPSRFLLELGLKRGVMDFGNEAKNNKAQEPASLGASSPRFAGEAGRGGQKNEINDENTKLIYELPKFYSYTQLQSYDTCPHQYFRDHVLKIPKPGKHFFSFGQSMHLAMQKFFAILMQSQSSVQHDLFGQVQNKEQLAKTLTLETLIKLYEESWIDDWYKNKEDKMLYFKKGKEQLKEFFKKHEGNWPKVIGLEQTFRLRISGYPVYGKIDRVDDLGNGAVQIVDYKTTEMKNKSLKEEGSHHKNQLLLYQLAASEVLQKKPAKLELYFLSINEPYDFLGSQADIEKMQKWVMDTIHNIEGSIKNNFFPHSSEPCRFCKKSDDIGQFLEV